jgi:hypothetical protein
MTEVDLYNLSPTLRLLGMGVLIALLPLALTRSHSKNILPDLELQKERELCDLSESAS